MLVAAGSTPQNPVVTHLPTAVYRHSRRADWGLAAIVWERDGKRGYRFEDGSERTFKEGYYELFDAVGLDADNARQLLADIERDALQSKSESDRSTRRAIKDAPKLEELIAVFRELYADGFADAKWTKRYRGTGVRRRAKRHRDAAIRDAAKVLAKDALDERLRAGDAAGVLQAVVDLMAATDLVTPTQIKALRTAEPRLDLAQALRDMLHEPDPEGIHFDRALTRLVRAGVMRPSWTLLSGLRALVNPEKNICIRPGVFFSVAWVISPRLARKVSPKGGHYNRLAAMARDLRDRLKEAGEVPRDMFDVYDFIWETCRPKAAETLAEVRRRATTTLNVAPDTTETETVQDGVSPEEPDTPTAEAA